MKPKLTANGAYVPHPELFDLDKSTAARLLLLNWSCNTCRRRGGAFCLYLQKRPEMKVCGHASKEIKISTFGSFKIHVPFKIVAEDGRAMVDFSDCRLWED